MKDIKFENSVHFQYSLDPYLTSWWMGIHWIYTTSKALNTISSWDLNHSKISKWEIPVFQSVHLKKKETYGVFKHSDSAPIHDSGQDPRNKTYTLEAWDLGKKNKKHEQTNGRFRKDKDQFWNSGTSKINWPMDSWIVKHVWKRRPKSRWLWVKIS